MARESEAGWLMSITLYTNDCYGGVIVDCQGADLEVETLSIIIQGAKNAGAFMQDPAGWLQLYDRPNPKSTVGTYAAGITVGAQGAIFPYVPTTIVTLTLTEDSTEAAALVSATVEAIAITDPRLFMRSLRSVLGMPVILPIDPALLVPGREQLTTKGVLEEGKKK